MKCYVLNALLTAQQPSLLFTSFIYVLASPAHLYMPQLFTQCLPYIICVTLMSIVYMYCKTITFILLCVLFTFFVSLHYFCVGLCIHAPFCMLLSHCCFFLLQFYEAVVHLKFAASR